MMTDPEQILLANTLQRCSGFLLQLRGVSEEYPPESSKNTNHFNTSNRRMMNRRARNHVVCDYATRYPEAIALRTIDADTIVEELIGEFARVGILILTDQGSNFMSTLYYTSKGKSIS